MSDLIGNLDDGVSSDLTGWAVDPANPDQPVEIELRISTGDVARVKADAPREGLTVPGAGPNHGFRVKLPPAAFNGPIIVSARHAGTGEAVPGSPKHMRPPVIDLLAGDVVDNCNLRCPFCLVDYSQIRGLRQMTMETYGRMVAIMPIVNEGMAWLSCLHEPTLNSRLADMIGATPTPLRRRLSFTTNLCKKLDDRTLEALANSGMHHMRISYDTRDPELFARLRKGGLYANFLDNLQRLVGHLRKASSPLPLAFVTMALRDNWREIPDLVRACADLCQPIYHEVRFMYYQPHLAEWGKEHALGLADWEELQLQLKAIPPPTVLILSQPENDAPERFEAGERDPDYQATPVAIGGAYTEAPPPVPDPFALGSSLPNEPLQLRLRWDGLLVRGETPLLNLNHLDDPVAYFRTVRSVTRVGPDEVWR